MILDSVNLSSQHKLLLFPAPKRTKSICSPLTLPSFVASAVSFGFLQRMTSQLYGSPKYPDWLPTSAYADTGERSGFVRSVFSSEAGVVDLVDEIEGGSDNCGLDSPSPAEVVPFSELTESAATLAKMQGVLVPHMPVTTAAEVKKFSDDFMKFLGTGGYSAVNFNSMALDWNQAVSDMEKGKIEVAPIFRKTAGHLQTYWKK